jgi:hypothetical protein
MQSDSPMTSHFGLNDLQPKQVTMNEIPKRVDEDLSNEAIMAGVKRNSEE